MTWMPSRSRLFFLQKLVPAGGIAVKSQVKGGKIS